MQVLRTEIKHGKPFLTYNEQADLLISRGLMADREELVGKLERVGYHRFSGYLHPYKQSDGTFREGTTLDEVWPLHIRPAVPPRHAQRHKARRGLVPFSARPRAQGQGRRLRRSPPYGPPNRRPSNKWSRTGRPPGSDALAVQYQLKNRRGEAEAIDARGARELQ